MITGVKVQGVKVTMTRLCQNNIYIGRIIGKEIENNMIIHENGIIGRKKE